MAQKESINVLKFDISVIKRKLWISANSSWVGFRINSTKSKNNSKEFNKNIIMNRGNPFDCQMQHLCKLDNQLNSEKL